MPEKELAKAIRERKKALAAKAKAPSKPPEAPVALRHARKRHTKPR